MHRPRQPFSGILGLPNFHAIQSIQAKLKLCGSWRENLFSRLTNLEHFKILEQFVFTLHAI